MLIFDFISKTIQTMCVFDSNLFQEVMTIEESENKCTNDVNTIDCRNVFDQFRAVIRKKCFEKPEKQRQIASI